MHIQELYISAAAFAHLRLNCLLPVGSLLAAAEETSPFGGVYPRAAVRIRG